MSSLVVFFFQAEDGIRDVAVTGVQTCALPIYEREAGGVRPRDGADHPQPHREALEPEQAEHADDPQRDRDLDAEGEEHEHQPDEEAAENGLAHSTVSGATSSRADVEPSAARTCRTNVTSMARAMRARPAGMKSMGSQSG